MNSRLIQQAKHAILSNKSVERDIKLSLSDKCQLKRISKKLRNNHNEIENLSFEEFVLLCKHMKKETILIVKSKHCTRVVNLLNFNINTLRYMMINILREIEDYNEYDLYKDLDISLLKQNYIDKQAILFEDFYDLCKKLNVNIDID
jgi:hypothetical protein